MSVQLLSRILLTTLCLGMWGAAIFFAAGGYLPYGLILFAIGAAGLLWIWKPWQYLRRHS
ncbi:MAG: hypothetical protein HGA45_30165 [Chloroflexales bacterium]|nr:hypothetical protein [Chloroflexales bacterium]